MNNSKVFVLHHIKLSHTVSYPVMLCYKVFTIMKDYFKEKGIDVYDIIDFVDENNKSKIIDEKKNYELNDNEIKEIYLESVKRMIQFIADNKIKNSTIFGFHPYGFDQLFKEYSYPVLRENNFKLILWHDDLHSFNRNVNRSTSLDMDDHRLDKVDCIITPSYNYLRNLNSKYLPKSKFYFYCLNDNFFGQLPINNFKKRKNKILLSGASGNGYPVRNSIRNFFVYNKQLQSAKKPYHLLFNNIDYLEHPGYDRNLNKGKTGLDYLKILNSYKGAFFGFLEYPLDHPLAKIIEILGSGTLGFLEYHPILEEQLGLKKFVHYVPILVDSKKKLIFDTSYYLKYLESDEGEKIMKQGCKYVRERFNLKNKCDEIISIIGTVNPNENLIP